MWRCAAQSTEQKLPSSWHSCWNAKLSCLTPSCRSGGITHISVTRASTLDQVHLELQHQDAVPPENVVRAWQGMTVELVHVAGSVDLQYRLNGVAHYIALHDMTMVDGETRLDGAPSMRVLDLRDRMTFLPLGCGISGWSRLTERRHSFVALHFRTATVEAELEMPVAGTGGPEIYFQDRPLQATLRKMQSALGNPEAANDIYIETLAMLAILETHRHGMRGAPNCAVASGSLTHAQERLLRDYIADNLSQRISLGELASLVGLSRFHFARAFKRTFGSPPHRFVTACRIEKAKQLLTHGALPVSAIATLTGFTSAVQFATAFRRATALAPLQFRRSQR
jgi:AraC family transcriptional regulator